MSYSLSFTKSIFVVIFISDKIRQKQFEYLSTADISKYLSIPKPTLVKILQSLNSANIIETKEGKNGGIRLLKRPSKITLLEIFEAMEKGKPLFQTNYNILANAKRPNNAQKSIKTILSEAEKQMKNELSNKTIGDILIEMNG
jgi:Rrf2 family protein